MLSRFGLPLIEKVCTQHPEVHLQIREEGSVVLHELLTNGKIEVAISATRPDATLAGEEILTEPIILMYPAAWDLPDSATLADLANLPWIVPRRPNAIRTLVDAVFASGNLVPNVVVEIDSLHSAIETVRRGLGVGAMTMGVIREDVAAGRLRARPLGSAPLMRSMFLARRRAPGLTPAAQFVFEILRDLGAEARLEEAGSPG
jgi:LysR family nitrogen assimilation transcriptional regulator